MAGLTERECLQVKDDYTVEVGQILAKIDTAGMSLCIAKVRLSASNAAEFSQEDVITQNACISWILAAGLRNTAPTWHQVVAAAAGLLR